MYIIKDTILNKSKETELQTYYIGKDGHVWTERGMADRWKRKDFAIKEVKKEADYTYNSNFTQHDETTFTFFENQMWFHIVQIIEI